MSPAPRSEQRVLLEAMTPAVRFSAVSKDDNADLPDGPCKGLYVGTQGNLSIIGTDDTNPVLLVNVVGWLPIAVKRVRSTGTSAADIVALYGEKY